MWFACHLQSKYRVLFLSSYTVVKTGTEFCFCHSDKFAVASADLRFNKAFLFEIITKQAQNFILSSQTSLLVSADWYWIYYIYMFN